MASLKMATTYYLGDTNTVIVVLVSVTIKRLKLTSLSPSQGMTEIIGRVAVDRIIISYSILFVKKKLLTLKQGAEQNKK